MFCHYLTVSQAQPVLFGGMLFADDFVGVSDSKESLQKLIDVVYSYCSKWRLQANVIKSAVLL